MSCLSAEAEREGVSLPELERAMLYFSETAWTLPDMMEKSEALDLEYDQQIYECKIAGLAAGFRLCVRKQDPDLWAAWVAARKKLKQEDHTFRS